MKRKKIPGRPAFGSAVTLSAMPADGADGVWNTLAYEATLKATGVTLVKADFEACVRNFALYPKVPVVIEHADTALFGNAEWAEPHGWVTDLRVGTFTRPDGRAVASLEGKVSLDAATRVAVRGDDANPPKWPFGSVTVCQGHDEESDEPLGMVLWSFSLTAHPRLKDVPRLAASRRPGDALEAGYYYGAIDDRDDLLDALRSIFELPALATEADVLAQVARFEGLVADPAAAEGVDVDQLLRQLREALRLPVLTTSAEVLAEVRKGLAQPAAPTTMSRGAAASPTEEMVMLKFLELAAKYGIAASNEDDAREKLLALAAESPEVRGALKLGATATKADVLGAITALSVAAGKVPALEAKVTQLSQDAEARAAAERQAHVDAYVAEDAEAREPSRAALEAFAASNYDAFAKAYPRPEPVAQALAARDAVAEAKERAKDAGRFARLSGQGATAPTDGHELSAEQISAGARMLMGQARKRGEHLSFASAVDLFTAGDAPVDDVDDEDPALDDVG